MSRKKIIIPIIVLTIILLCIINTLIFNEKKTLRNSNVKIKWFHQAQFAGIYNAIEKGFYEKRGLNITIYEYDDEDIAEEVSNGKYDFGIIGADELIIARSNGLKVKAIAVIYKTNPSCAYTTNTNIKNPLHFKNKTIGLIRGTNIETSFYLMKNVLNISEVKEVFIDSDAGWLDNNSIDVFTGYIINEPNILFEKGYYVEKFLFSDYGVNIYGDVIITSDENIINDPEVVFNFVAATIEGWNYAYTNKAETLEIIKKYVPIEKYNYDHQKLMLEESIPLIFYNEKPLGLMSLDKWEHTQDLLIRAKIINEMVDDYFTNDFVEKYYDTININ